MLYKGVKIGVSLVRDEMKELMTAFHKRVEMWITWSLRTVQREASNTGASKGLQMYHGRKREKHVIVTVKGKVIPLQARCDPEGG